MLFAHIDYLDSSFEIKHGFVGTENGRISYIGAEDPTCAAEPRHATADADSTRVADLATDTDPPHAAASHTPPPHDFGERYDGTGKLLIPGLYNAHTHAPMTLMRGYAENLSLHDWLNQRIFPFEDKMTDADAYPATLLAIAEMLRFGTVSFTDMYCFNEARIQAIAESGIKANLCSGIICLDERSYDELPAKQIDAELIAAHHNTLEGRLKIDLNIHAEYTTTPHVVQAVGDYALECGVQTHIHLSETKAEHEECKQRRGGKTPTEYFDSLDFFRTPCTAAHCVYTEAQDWEILAARGVTAVCNPASNMKLASGFAPVPQMIAAGVNVALGTDGVASNNNHNLLKELYLMALVYKGASLDPTALTPADVLRAATVNGAYAQRREGCGSIRLGNHADLVVLDTHTPWMQPVHDMCTNLVYSAQGSDVVLTMVDGKVLYRDGHWPTLDLERAIAQTQDARDAVLARLDA
jgi:5-methylthioadenosine/S-adenosylhomocysteine deaminase